jgi:hypothetical protein
MKATTITRIFMVLSALTLVSLMPATCHAQAEVSPDCYTMDNTVSAQPALATAQPASAELALSKALPSQPRIIEQGMISGHSALLDRLDPQSALLRVRTASANYLHELMTMLRATAQVNPATALNTRVERVTIS